VKRRRHLAAAGAVALGVLAVQGGLAAPAQAAGQRYASTTGSGTACTSVAPCDIVTAVNQATSGTEVIIAAGTYNLGAALANSQSGVNVHGTAGQPRPVINSSASPALALLGSAARAADLTINQNGGAFGVQVFATGILVQRLEVHSSAADACAIGYSGLVRDLLCVSTAAGGVALEDSWGGGTGTLTLRNVTAVATGTGSYGIRANSTGNDTNLDVSARNVIASGALADIGSGETGINSESDVILSYSNFDKIEELGGGNVSDVGSVSTNQTALPIFLDTTLYHQAQTSPTVDKGTTDVSVGTADLDGDLRRLGAATDIGADEYDTIPPNVAFVHVPKQKTHKHKVKFSFVATEAVTFTCKVDKKKAEPCSSPFKVKVKRYGKHKITVTARDGVGNVDPTPATYSWKLKHKHKRKHHHHGHHHHHHHHHRTG
jgi:hypothetical protein